MFETSFKRAQGELSSELQSTLTGLQSRIRRTHASDNARQAALTYDERGEVLTSNDWDEFRKATEKLSSCREAVAAIRGLEETIAYQISELGALATTPASADTEQNVVDFASPATALTTSTINTTALHELITKSKRILSTAAWRTSKDDMSLLPQAHASVLAIASAVQTFQHDLVLSQFLPELELYPSLPIWTSNKHPSIVNEYDLAMPKFSLSPTEAMARIGEAMLNLPRLFEGYADEVLLFCLPTVKPEASKGEISRAEKADVELGHTRQSTMVPPSTYPRKRQQLSDPPCTAKHSPPPPAPIRIVHHQRNLRRERRKQRRCALAVLRSLLALFFTRLLTSVLPSLPRLTEIGPHSSPPTSTT